MEHLTAFVLWLSMFLLFTKLSKVNDVNFCLLLDQSTGRGRPAQPGRGIARAGVRVMCSCVFVVDRLRATS